MDRKVKEELNALSAEVFGSSSRWAKLVDKGYTEIVTEEKEETTPIDSEGKGGEVVKVRVPVKTASGAVQYVTKRHTIESVRELMLDMKAKRDAYIAALTKAKEEEAAKKAQEALQKKVNEELMGSALT
jgi:CRISPR/Cas system CMR subunit Cmr4 (Cas7 group RAMP superfamily)